MPSIVILAKILKCVLLVMQLPTFGFSLSQGAYHKRVTLKIKLLLLPNALLPVSLASRKLYALLVRLDIFWIKVEAAFELVQLAPTKTSTVWFAFNALSIAISVIAMELASSST